MSRPSEAIGGCFSWRSPGIGLRLVSARTPPDSNSRGSRHSSCLDCQQIKLQTQLLFSYDTQYSAGSTQFGQLISSLASAELLRLELDRLYTHHQPRPHIEQSEPINRHHVGSYIHNLQLFPLFLLCPAPNGAEPQGHRV